MSVRVRTAAPDTLMAGPASWSFLALNSGLKPAWTTQMLILYEGDPKTGFTQGKFGKCSQLGDSHKHGCDISHHSMDLVSCTCHH